MLDGGVLKMVVEFAIQYNKMAIHILLDFVVRQSDSNAHGLKQLSWILCLRKLSMELHILSSVDSGET